jgi:hypothetical protein
VPWLRRLWHGSYAVIQRVVGHGLVMARCFLNCLPLAWLSPGQHSKATASDAVFKELATQQRNQAKQAQETALEIRAQVRKQSETQAAQALEVAQDIRAGMATMQAQQIEANTAIMRTLNMLLDEIRNATAKPVKPDTATAPRGDTMHGALLISLIAFPLGKARFRQSRQSEMRAAQIFSKPGRDEFYLCRAIR